MPQIFNEDLNPVCENIAANQPLWFPDRDGEDTEDKTLEESTQYKKKIPKSSKKQEYIDYLEGKGIEVCNPDNFCRPKFLIGMKIRLPDVCPWVLGHREIAIRYTLSYSVGISEPVRSFASDKIEIENWTKRAPFDHNITANSANFLGNFPVFADPDNSIYFDHEPPPPMVMTRIEEIRSNPANLQEVPTIQLTGTLVDDEWDSLAGQSVVQHRLIPCEYSPLSPDGFQELIVNSGGGSTMTMSWTMIGPASVYNPIFTLIRGLILQVRSIGWGD